MKRVNYENLLQMTKLRNFYQIFGRILVLEGQVMYQFCFVPKMRNFVV